MPLLNFSIKINGNKLTTGIINERNKQFLVKKKQTF